MSEAQTRITAGCLRIPLKLESRMLQGFLIGLAEHLQPQGEGWMILSDLAEYLGLRTREALLDMIVGARLQVLGKMDTKPQHPRVSDTSDP